MNTDCRLKSESCSTEYSVQGTECADETDIHSVCCILYSVFCIPFLAILHHLLRKLFFSRIALVSLGAISSQ